MKNAIGIRLEDKNRWERRTPLVPGDVAGLLGLGVAVRLQKSPVRAFSEDEYAGAGAEIAESLGGTGIVLGIKEMPEGSFEPGGVYAFFSHTIKGQKHNMGMLRTIMKRKCTLIDYEKITDDAGRRLIFFGNWAGLAGMIDTLWALGRRLLAMGVETPFAAIEQAWKYPDAAAAKEAVSRAGAALRKKGLPKALSPAVFAFLGYGNVSRGAQEIFDLLKCEEIGPPEIGPLARRSKPPVRKVFKAIFKESDLVEPAVPGAKFELGDYFANPGKYRSKFAGHLPDLTAIVNCVYWDARYPRFVTVSDLRRLFEAGEPRLKVIGDISCDVGGSIEATVKTTTPDNPVFVFNPADGGATDGVEGDGVVILAVDNLPCELPRESSSEFSKALRDFVPALARADFGADFEALNLPEPVKRAVVVHKGELTPAFKYMEKFLSDPGI